PVTSDWSRFLRELAALEAATGARVTELVVADEVLPVAPVEAPPADPAAEDTATEAPSQPAPTEDGSASAAGTGLIEIPITVTVSGTPDQIAQFFRQLQTGERLVFVSGVEIDSTGETPSGVVSGLIYVVPGATPAD
ncbi:MAG: type 4a pilus biogenesis protein PilO, partial [Actinobacteria bacterium]|nr:type 4a pilus biogenesis protein PilO [Actinomycetota bacterium]